jgi:hypothetical protein
MKFNLAIQILLGLWTAILFYFFRR